MQPSAQGNTKTGTQHRCPETTKPRPARKRSHKSSVARSNRHTGTARTTPKPPSSNAAKSTVPAPAPSTSTTPTTAAASSSSAATYVWSTGLGANAAAIGSLAQVIGNGDPPPSYLIPIYQAAGRRYHIPWQVLAAINGIETNYGRDTSTSPAGAIGWMQFMPATWSEYAVAVGQGKPNPYDPRAAIFAAAHLLAANGGAPTTCARRSSPTTTPVGMWTPCSGANS
jgi:membrane-bound lytic murein transglycosylase B